MQLEHNKMDDWKLQVQIRGQIRKVQSALNGKSSWKIGAV